VADDQIPPLRANRIWNRLIVEVTFRKGRLPKGNASSETYAYSLEDIMRMLDALPGHVVPIVAATASLVLSSCRLRRDD